MKLLLIAILFPASLFAQTDTNYLRIHAGLDTSFSWVAQRGGIDKYDTLYAIMLVCDTVRQTGKGYNVLKTQIGGTITVHGVRQNVIPWVYWIYGYVVKRTYEFPNGLITHEGVIFLGERRKPLDSTAIVWDYKILEREKKKAF